MNMQFQLIFIYNYALKQGNLLCPFCVQYFMNPAINIDMEAYLSSKWQQTWENKPIL